MYIVVLSACVLSCLNGARMFTNFDVFVLSLLFWMDVMFRGKCDCDCILLTFVVVRIT